jgi:AcrR family transcriptional regulator
VSTRARTRKRRTPPRRRLSRAERRERIEQSAAELFAERGYHGAAIDEIARRAGVTPPVVYDHFTSKKDLYQGLLVRHYAALRDIWFAYAFGEQPIQDWMPKAVDEWYAYVEANRHASRILFREPTGDAMVTAVQREVTEASRSEVMPLVRRETTKAGIADDAVWMDLTWEILRGVLQGLALWWYDHPDVPRERIVEAAMNGMWLGFERVLAGERWRA